MSEEHLDLSYDAEQNALAVSVRGVVARSQTDGDEPRGYSPALWKGLAELGVLGLATPEGGGGAQEIAAVMEVLGEAAAPGPLVPAFMAAQLTGEPERSRIASGDSVAWPWVSPPLMPWAPVADVFVELAADAAWIARPAGDVEAVETLAGEPWGRVPAGARRSIDDASRRRALVIGDVAVAAYLVGAADHLVAITSQWLQDRVQFGRPIGQFQSLAHPLADIAIRTACSSHPDAHRRIRRRSARMSRAQLRRRRRHGSPPLERRSTPRTGRTSRSAPWATPSKGPSHGLGNGSAKASLHPPGPAAARRELVLAAIGL